MAELYKIYEVKVVAEYWARIELNVKEQKTDEEIEEMAWREFYDEAHRASIEETNIEDTNLYCSECEEQNVDDDHECEEEETEEDEEESEEETN
jgi:hypothetical protein